MSGAGTRPALRRLLVLEAPERSADGGGGVVVSWEALGALWADVQPVSGRETIIGAREHARVSHRIMVRGAPEGSPARPRPEQRLREGARVFAVHAVSEHDPMGRYLTIWAEEGTGA
ncbi:head-tail adaptor protein [Paroceanicella profunda]|uniref:Head-tail adaptor protein n=1 Tax=Paroceanicella profunda TaxID=2579971 RepID=A0A5B8G1X3_9RHOB|nr:head-tail adaptor protein [Paroceanicella profunda]QDL93082.1 head-tail adaptor protein [Paroceanicella profunda]